MGSDRLFDEVVYRLGLRYGTELARALGQGPSAATNWRRLGFPKGIKWSVYLLARQRGVELPNEFFEDTETYVQRRA
jgi:hypothetical protein